MNRNFYLRKDNARNSPRVCMFTSSHSVDYSRFWDREVQTLKRGGYRVTLIGLGKGFHITTIERIKIISVPESWGWNKFTLVKKIAVLALKERADIYHCLDPWCLAIGLRLKIRHPQIRVVYESSEWFPQTYRDRKDFPVFLRWLAWFVVTGLEYNATRKIDAIIETNQTRAQRFVRRGLMPVQVPNYPPIEIIGVPHKERIPAFVYTGLICRERGFHHLVKALAIVTKAGFPGAKLFVRGEFDWRDDIEMWVRSFIEREKLEKNVVFLARTASYSAVFDIIKPCLAGMILFQPGRGNDWTNQPNKLFEFMGCGVAVIASEFPEIARIVRETNCGWLVDPTQPATIAEVMLTVLDNPTEAIQRGLAGRRAVQLRYNWHTAEEALLDLYRTLSLKKNDNLSP